MHNVVRRFNNLKADIVARQTLEAKTLQMQQKAGAIRALGAARGGAGGWNFKQCFFFRSLNNGSN